MLCNNTLIQKGLFANEESSPIKKPCIHDFITAVYLAYLW